MDWRVQLLQAAERGLAVPTSRASNESGDQSPHSKTCGSSLLIKAPACLNPPSRHRTGNGRRHRTLPSTPARWCALEPRAGSCRSEEMRTETQLHSQRLKSPPHEEPSGAKHWSPSDPAITRHALVVRRVVAPPSKWCRLDANA